MDEQGSRSQELQAELDKIDAEARARRARMARLLRLGSVLVALSCLFWLRSDLAYAFASATPVDLGGPLEFNNEAEVSNRYARIAAVPGDMRANFDRFGRHYRMFGLMGSNVLVVEDLSQVDPDAQPVRGEVYRAQGRLLRDDDADELRRVIELYEAKGIVSRQGDHIFVLRAGEAPRQGYALPLQLLAILAFVVVNWVGARRIERPLPELGEGDPDDLSDG